MRILLGESLPRPLAVAILIATSNRIESLQPLVPELLRVLPALKRGDLIRVAA